MVGRLAIVAFGQKALYAMARFCHPSILIIRYVGPYNAESGATKLDFDTLFSTPKTVIIHSCRLLKIFLNDFLVMKRR